MKLELAKTYGLTDATLVAPCVYLGVYKITQKSTGKIYIGQSKNLRTRLRSYLGEGPKKQKRPFCKILQDVPLSDFYFEILEFTERPYEREQYYINLFDATNPCVGYNISENHVPEGMRDLALAWCRNEISVTQIAKALGYSFVTQKTYAKIALALKQYITNLKNTND